VRALVAAALLSIPAAASAQGSLAGVRYGVTTQPESVTVGDQVVLRVRVSAPPGATIVFPAGPDTSAQVQAVVSRTVTPNASANGVDQTAAYTLVPWDVGEVAAKLGDVVVTLGGETRRIALADAVVHVKSVLPADSTLRVPKPARPVFDVLIPWWKKWWPLLVALALLALLLWWWWRRRRRSAGAAADVDAFAFAEREFGRIESLGLVDAGERGRHVALMVDVLRDYLAMRVPEARASLTSSELVRALRGDGRVPHARLAALLDETDLVKFARRPVAPDRAHALGRDARSIAREVEAAVTKPETPAPAREAA
jgi:hypothetical protein